MAWLTPNEEGGTVFRLLAIPDTFLPMVNGALNILCQEYSWEKFDDLTPEQCTDKMNAMLDVYFESGYMIGTIHPYATSSPPDNMLPCDGSSYDRVDYPLLYAALDAQFIDGADTFHVPDLNGRFLLCASADMGDEGGEAEHTTTVDEMPPHSHTMPYESCFPYGEIPEVCVVGGLLTQQTGSTGGGQPHNNMPPYTKMPFGIVCR